MPEFKSSLVGDHRDIQKEIDHFIEFLNGFDRKSSDHIEDLKRILDVVDKTVFDHLATEEKTLEAENMKKYWSLKDLEKFDFL
jgi:hypothetical protein